MCGITAVTAPDGGAGAEPAQIVRGRMGTVYVEKRRRLRFAPRSGSQAGMCVKGALPTEHAFTRERKES